MSIDWSKAPEWADRHGFVPCGGPVWFNDEQYTYVSGEQGQRAFSFAAREGYRRREIRHVEDRPVADPWNGEGLPPVGTVCEYKHLHEWQKVEIFAIKPNCNGSQTALFTFENGTWCGCAEPWWFRPIRTPAQIAAEERQAKVDEMMEIIYQARKLLPLTPASPQAEARVAAEALYDANYRKQVTP